MTYDQLRQTIQSATEDDGDAFQEQIDNFITQAENLIYQSVRLPKFTNTASLTLSANTPTITAPQDFLSVDFIAFGGSPLYKKDTSFLTEIYPIGSTGSPRFFAMRDDETIVIGPTPDQAYSGTMQYFCTPATIVGQAAETYLSNRFPTALLNGSLMFAAVFQKNPDMVALYQQIFVNAVGLAGKFKTESMKQAFEKVNAAVSTEN